MILAKLNRGQWVPILRLAGFTRFVTKCCRRAVLDQILTRKVWMSYSLPLSILALNLSTHDHIKIAPRRSRLHRGWGKLAKASGAKVVLRTAIRQIPSLFILAAGYLLRGSRVEIRVEIRMRMTRKQC